MRASGSILLLSSMGQDPSMSPSKNCQQGSPEWSGAQQRCKIAALLSCMQEPHVFGLKTISGSVHGCVSCAQQRDPGRSFVLGERISYVLLPGPVTQDEAAEEPLAAAKAGLQVRMRNQKRV